MQDVLFGVSHSYKIIIHILAFQYMNKVRQFKGYGQVHFPHCVCDCRKEGHVIALIDINSFKLHACKEDGTLEVKL